MLGEKIGRREVLEYVPCEKQGRHFRVRCSCGREDVVLGSTLRTQPRCRDCGAREKKVQHGARRKKRTTPEYRAWTGLLSRCYNTRNAKYHRYGGRGIKVCDRWRESFTNFLSDVGYRPSPRHTLDRENNDGDYEPGNVHWVLPRDQARNRSNNRPLEALGQTRLLIEWANAFAIHPTTITGRLSDGWHPDKAVTVPAARRGPTPYTKTYLQEPGAHIPC